MKTDILTNGSTVKNHISIKTGLGFSATRRTSFLLSSSSSGSSSTSTTPLRQESHSSSSSSTSSSSPTVSENQTREREDRIDISPMQVSNSVDDRSGRPDDTQTNKTPKSKKKESKKEQSESLCSEIPEWLQEFRWNLVDDEIPEHRDSHASSSHEVSLEPTTKRREDLGKHRVYTHLPEDRNCEICKRTKITRALCRRRNGGAVPCAQKFWWLDNSRSQSSQWKLWISKKSPIRSHGAGLSHPMDPGVSVQDQNFKRNSEKLAKVLGAREETKSHFHWQFLGIRQSLWRFLLESLHVYTTQIRNKWDCWKSSAQSKGRHLCCIVAIGSKWKLVGRFHGMLHLSAKRHRFIIWWEDALWETFWRTF